MDRADRTNEPPQPDYEELGRQLHLMAQRFHWLSTQHPQPGGKEPTPFDGSNPMATLMHLVSELSEAFQVLKNGGAVDLTYLGTDRKGNPKPEGFRIELADAVIGIVHLAWIHGGIGDAIMDKMAYREEHGW